MANGTIRVGVAGAGVFGGYHAAKLAEAGALAAVFDADGDRALGVADRHDAEAYDDLEAFLDVVDAVVVALPATHHFAAATAALARGRHVLVEKPLALTLDDADTLIGAARAAGLVLQVGHQEAYVAGAMGLLGRAVRPLLVASRRLNGPSGRAGDVSVVMDLMIHDLDLLARLSGTHEAVVTRCEARGPAEAADWVHAEVSVGTVTASLTASRVEETARRDLALTYPDGEVRLDFLTRDATNTTPVPLAATFGGADAPLALSDPLAYGTRAFLAAVAGQGPPGATGAEGRAALALALAVEEAVRGELS